MDGSGRWAQRVTATASVLVLALALVWMGGCRHSAPDPMRYRLAHSGTHWDRVGEDRVLEDLQPRYPDFFAVVLDPSHTGEVNHQHHIVDLREGGDKFDLDFGFFITCKSVLFVDEAEFLLEGAAVTWYTD